MTVHLVQHGEMVPGDSQVNTCFLLLCQGRGYPDQDYGDLELPLQDTLP